MKNKLSIVCVVLSLFVVLATARAFAQTEGRITTNIPFAFVAGNKVLPAGEYTIQRGVPEDPELLLIRSADNRVALFLNVEDTYARQTPTETKLIFNRIGDEYFLSRIWVAGVQVGREVPRSRAERELERAEAKNLVHAVTVIPMEQ